MPAKNPRLTITLQPVIAAQLRRLSELTGNSQSSLIAELLDGSTAVFERVIRVLEAAEEAQRSIKGSLAQGLGDAQSKVEEQLGLALDIFDGATLPLLEDLETVKRRSRKATRSEQPEALARGRLAAEPTPMSNRGVRSDPTATKSIAHNVSAARPKPAKQGAKTRGGV